MSDNMKTQIKRAVKTLIGSKEPAPLKYADTPDFITWLRFANAGMLQEGNIYCFEYAIERLPSESPVIEIGSFCGLSTNIISFYLRKHRKPNKLITSDKWIFEGGEDPNKNLGGSNIPHRDYKKFVKETFIRNVSFFSKDHLPYTIEEFSDSFFDLWKAGKEETDVLGRKVQLGGPISFAYIDGNHTYEYAKRDFRNTDKFLEVGGFILFDDSSDLSPFGVGKVIDEIKASSKYQVILKNPNYLVQKVG